MVVKMSKYLPLPSKRAIILQFVVTYATDMYSWLSKTISEIYVFNFVYRSSGFAWRRTWGSVDIFRSRRGPQAVKSGRQWSKESHQQSFLYFSAASGTLHEDLHRVSCSLRYKFAVKALFCRTRYFYVAEKDVQVNTTHVIRCSFSTATMVTLRATLLLYTCTVCGMEVTFIHVI